MIERLQGFINDLNGSSLREARSVRTDRLTKIRFKYLIDNNRLFNFSKWPLLILLHFGLSLSNSSVNFSTSLLPKLFLQPFQILNTEREVVFLTFLNQSIANQLILKFI